jgi:hypothetical protein
MAAIYEANAAPTELQPADLVPPLPSIIPPRAADAGADTTTDCKIATWVEDNQMAAALIVVGAFLLGRKS